MNDKHKIFGWRFWVHSVKSFKNQKVVGSIIRPGDKIKLTECITTPSNDSRLVLITIRKKRRPRSQSKEHGLGASLVAQWLRIHLPMQGTRVRALVQEDPTCHGATKPMHHNYWACAQEPTCTMTEAHVPRACALQQKNPPQWEARAPQRRVAPASHN